MFDVVVLMSTYNGAAFLREQIDSILRQEGVGVHLVVRDDGSTDATCSILDEYAARGQVVWTKGQNVGPAKSFMALLADAPSSPFYAFADQDDIWQPEKLRKAIERILHHDSPALYVSQTQLVDAELNPLPTPQLTPRLTFGESQIYAFASGCTMVMNDRLRCFVVGHTPSTMPMLHDFWVYTLAQGIGASIEFDKVSHILYRQHGGNAVGLGTSFVNEWKQRFRRIFLKRMAERSRNTQILYDTIGSEMTPENALMAKRLIEAKTSTAKRLRLFLDSRFRCGDKRTWILFKLATILNTY